MADDAFVLMERDGANVYDAATAVANELATIGSPGVIVVDDLHLAAPDPALLTAFTDALPDGFRFVAATRSDPPLSLARLRLRGDLLELRGNDLGFDPAEMSEFLAPYDLCLTDDELRRLHELTEGWPAGVQLAAIALQRGVEHEEFLQAFASTDRAISDFLVSEMLTGLPPDLVDFLVETSVLDIFDAELCADVTGIEDTRGSARPPPRRQPVRRALGSAGTLVPLPPPVRGVPAGAAGIVGHRQASGGARAGMSGPRGPRG